MIDYPVTLYPVTLWVELFQVRDVIKWNVFLINTTEPGDTHMHLEMGQHLRKALKICCLQNVGHFVSASKQEEDESYDYVLFFRFRVSEDMKSCMTQHNLINMTASAQRRVVSWPTQIPNNGHHQTIFFLNLVSKIPTLIRPHLDDPEKKIMGSIETTLTSSPLP